MDIQSIMEKHAHKKKEPELRPSHGGPDSRPSSSAIPDIFYDVVLPNYKFTRIEIMVLMYLYRRVWCRPNLYKKFGISQLMSLTKMTESLKLSIDEVYTALRKLEELNFISTVRPGQYFVRKFFTKDLDSAFSQTYDDFEI